MTRAILKGEECLGSLSGLLTEWTFSSHQKPTKARGRSSDGQGHSPSNQVKFIMLCCDGAWKSESPLWVRPILTLTRDPHLECLLLRALQAQPQWGWDCGSPSFQLHDCEVNPARWMCCGTVILPRDQGITHAPILPLMNIVWFYTVFFFPPIPNYLRRRYDQRQFPYHDSFHTCLQSLGSVTQSRSATWFIAWTITTSSKDLQQQQAKIRSLKQVWTQAPRYGTLWTPGIPTRDAMNPRHTNMERYEPQVYWHGKLWNPGILTWDAMNPRNIDMGSRHRNWQLHHQIKCLPLVHEFELQWIIGVTFIVVLVF